MLEDSTLAQFGPRRPAPLVQFDPQVDDSRDGMRRNQEVLQWRDPMVGDDIERDPGSSQLDMELLQVKCFIDAM